MYVWAGKMSTEGERKVGMQLSLVCFFRFFFSRAFNLLFNLFRNMLTLLPTEGQRIANPIVSIFGSSFCVVFLFLFLFLTFEYMREGDETLQFSIHFQGNLQLFEVLFT